MGFVSGYAPPTPVSDGAGGQTVPASPNNNFANVGGYASQKVVEQLFDRPIFYTREVVSRHNERASFDLFLRNFGMGRGTDNSKVGHYEQDWLENSTKLGATNTASTGAGTIVVVTLDAGAMYNPSVTVGGSARQASYIRERDVVRFPNGKMAQVTVKDVSFTPHRITLKPLDATVDLGTITVGTVIFDAGNAFGEGTGRPASVLSRLFKWENYFQIQKEEFSLTGSELTNATHAMWNGKDGVFSNEVARTIRRFHMRIGKMYLFGQQSENTDTSATAVGYDVYSRTTQGLDQAATIDGNIDAYTAGSYTKADFSAVANIYNTQRPGTTSIMVGSGYSHYTDVQNALTTIFGTNTNGAWLIAERGLKARYNNSYSEYVREEDMAYYQGFNMAHMGGFDFCFTVLPELSAQNSGGAAGFTFPTYGYFFPAGLSADKNSGEEVPTIGYAWKAKNGYSREMVMGYRAGAGVGGSQWGIATSPDDVLDFDLTAELAFHLARPNQIVRQYAN